MPLDPKQAERDYYAGIGPEGIAHSLGKPFSDDQCAQYLAVATAVFGLLPPPPLRVVEFGCGTGWLSFFLAQRGYEVVGLDISTDAIAAAGSSARARNLARAEFVAGDYETFEFRETFDAAIFHDSLHHAEDELAALRCAWRALRPGGCAIAIEPGAGHHRTATSVNAVRDFGVHERDMPPHHIVALARRVGFRRQLALPFPHDLNRAFYRRAYHAAPSAAELLSLRILGTLRAIRRIFFKRKHGLVILWK
jgi:SAM-dependent methyltransferase